MHVKGNSSSTYCHNFKLLSCTGREILSHLWTCVSTPKDNFSIAANFGGIFRPRPSPLLPRLTSYGSPELDPDNPQKVVCCGNTETARTMAEVHRHWWGIRLR